MNLLISKILNYLYNEEIKILQNKVSVFNDLQTIKDLAFEISNCYLKKDALTLIKIVILSKIKTQNGVETIKNTDEIISREIISKEITNNVSPKMNPIIEIHNNKVQPKEITKPLKTVVINSHSDKEIKRLKMIRINNVFITASKINKETFNTNWNELKKDIKYKNSDLYSKIEDAEVEIVSDDIAVLSLNTETAVYLFNSNLETIEEEYNIKFNKKYKIICLLKQECTNAKKEYIKNKSKKYTYMEENLAESSVKENTTEENNNSALEIFGKDLIEIK